MRKILNFYIILGLIISIHGCGSPSEDSSNTWEDFVEFRAGNYPLLLIAPHGGDLKPQWITDRDCENAVVTQDQYTLGIALQIERALQEMGIRPYMVVAKIHRLKIDLNRSLETSHCEDDTSNDLWRLFHRQVEDYRQTIIDIYGRGLIIDIHGHGHPNQRIELGYLLTSQHLRELLLPNSQPQGLSSSMESLLNNHPQNLSLNDLVFGNQALGTLLSSSGFPAVPSSQDPAPLVEEPFFSGGTNTKLYGSRSRNGVDAIQLELNRQGLRAASADRERFAQTFAQILREYMQFHYADVLQP